MVIVVGGARKVTDRAPNEDVPINETDKTSKVTDSIAKVVARAPNEASPTKVTDRAIIGP
ncbi:hypothetical protein [Lysinibacillus fusiformis]|uniref:hypothetical protein n=1 Tax=Lysinibacillus fusiformis TaxID=28031 RepID=UPI0018801617|nr:hypothetical protein [Lysinibacillus fusiformis]MBD8520633.1 hypothetical protein [Lysinibacillus fusiformis]